MLVGAILVATELYISIGTIQYISLCVCVHVIGVLTTVCLAERSTGLSVTVQISGIMFS